MTGHPYGVDWHARAYSTPHMVRLRTAPGAAVCIDEDCDLSGGFAHVGECEPCACGMRHAVAECPVPGEPVPGDLDLSQHEECVDA